VDGQWDYLLDDQAGLGYIRITQFGSDTLEHFDQAVKDLRQHGMQALVLDLRSNPGGLMSEAVGMVDRLIDHGVIVSTRGAPSEEAIQYAQASGTYPHFHLVVLINLGSASASEIVAGALQDHDRAVIVGERSWGKGSVQRLFHLYNSEAALKLTTDYYYLPKGRCVHKRKGAESWGVEPDVAVAMDADSVETLRELSREFMKNPLIGRQRDETSSEQEDIKSLETKDKEMKSQLAERLLKGDRQLDQAVKQCRGLLRVRTVLSGLAESLEADEPMSDTAVEAGAEQE
jgi:carboxyl-terminal processing protease